MVVHHLDSSITIVAMPQPHRELMNSRVPTGQTPKIELETTYKNTESVFLQIARTSKKKDVFMCYDVTKHHVYFILLDLKKVNAEMKSFLEKKESQQPAETPAVVAPTLPPGEIYKLITVLYKKEMYLKRFDHFKFIGTNFVMQSEYWDNWLFKFVPSAKTT